jgi:hypothetical protein
LRRGDAERHGMHSHAERGNEFDETGDGFSRLTTFNPGKPATQATASLIGELHHVPPIQSHADRHVDGGCVIRLYCRTCSPASSAAVG